MHREHDLHAALRGDELPGAWRDSLAEPGLDRRPDAGHRVTVVGSLNLLLRSRRNHDVVAGKLRVQRHDQWHADVLAGGGVPGTLVPVAAGGSG